MLLVLASSADRAARHWAAVDADVCLLTPRDLACPGWTLANDVPVNLDMRVAESEIPELVIAAREGSRSAWNSLVQHYAPLVRSVARRCRRASTHVAACSFSTRS